MSNRTAHILEQKWRSDDIKISEDADFSSLLLPKELLRGLTGAGFKYPSPIQLKAIPAAKIGKDLIVQAKSGTGKTIVFTVAALNMLLKGATHPQVLIMAPTREIAFQISQVIKCVGVPYKGLKCDYFIGGRKLEEDVPRIEDCQIIVGTPGRIKQLISFKVLKTAGIRLFVLDEADQLLKDSSFATDIDDIFRALPRDKQMIATSATYPEKLKKLTNKFFREPLLICLNKNDIGLLGMVHYYRIIPVSKLPVVAYRQKLKFMENVLLSVKFAQCLVFCNMVSRVENLFVEIRNWGFATSYISSLRQQQDRLKAIELLKKFKCKVLVSSDVSARGIDAENVDLVINFDLPTHLDTYFHRVGRAGRYGSKCASVTFITSDEIEAYERMQTEGKFTSFSLPDIVPESLVSQQPKVKPSVKNEDLPLKDRSETSSDSSTDEEDLNENKVTKLKKANGVRKDIELNGHNAMPLSTSEVNEFAFENVTNPSDEKVNDSDVSSTESKDSLKKQNQLLDLNSNPTNSVKDDDDLSTSSEYMELESDKTESPPPVKLELQEVVTEMTLSTDSVAANNKSCGKNYKLVEGKLDQHNSVASVVEDTENCLPKTDKSASNIDGFEQIMDTGSCLVNPEDDSKKSEEITDGKSLVKNNERSLSKKFYDPKSKELISSCITFIKKYENCNNDFEKCSNPDSDQSSFDDSDQSSPFVKVESNDNKISPESLRDSRASLHQFHYDVHKDFIASISEDLIKEIAQGCGKENIGYQVSEIEEHACLMQNDCENMIQNSSLDSRPKLFSTPKAESLSGIKSGDSSGESSSGNDKDKLIEHFNLRLGSIQKVKPSDKNSTSESSSSSESNSDTSVNSGEAMYLLTKKFNQVSTNKNEGKANIIKVAELSNSSSSESASGTSVDSENAFEKLEQKFTEMIHAKKSDRNLSKETEETKKVLCEIKSTKNHFKGIKIVGTKKPAESSTDTSSDSDDIATSSSSSDSGNSKKAKRKPKKESNKKIQKMKSNVVNNIKSPESSSCKAKTIDGRVKNKVKYSETETDSDQHSKDTLSGPQHAPRNSDNTTYGCRRKILNRSVGNKITHNYSETSSSETENGSYSPDKSISSSKVVNVSKRNFHLKDETIPKNDSSQFPNAISHPWFNPILPLLPMSYPPHSNYQMQPSYFTSNQYYPPNPQQIQCHANGQYLGTQSSHQMQPTYVPNPLSQPYPSECPLNEACQMQRRSKPAGGRHIAGCSIDGSNPPRNSNSSRNPNYVQSSYQMPPSQYAYNMCIVPTQHPCHPPNETCQSPSCAAWYDIFYKQWQFINQSPYF